MRIAIMGAGGTGGFYGGLLARAGEDVIFIARGTHLEALRTRGLTISSRLAGDFCIPIHATDDPHTIEPVDLILFCVKSYDTESAIEKVRPLIHERTMIVPVQNGVESIDHIGRAFGYAHVLGGASYVSSIVTEPGVISQRAGTGALVFGELTAETSARAENLLQLFKRAGIIASLDANILGALWEKFIYICAFSGVTALTRLPIGSILDTPECNTLFLEVMQEVMAVGRAHGIAITEDYVMRRHAFAKSLEPWGRGSLYYDLVAGKRLELETLQGTVVRLGRRYGIATPVNCVIYAALYAYKDGAPKLPDPY